MSLFEYLGSVEVLGVVLGSEKWCLFGNNLNLDIWSLLGRLVKKCGGEVLPVELLIKFVWLSDKLSKALEAESAVLGFL